MDDPEQKFERQLTLLNAINSEYFRWERTSAKKEHIDQFGDVVQHGEQYFKRSTGQAFDMVIKMSRRSMERFLDALFNDNEVATSICERIAQEQLERHNEARSTIVKKLEEDQRNYGRTPDSK